MTIIFLRLSITYPKGELIGKDGLFKKASNVNELTGNNTKARCGSLFLADFQHSPVDNLYVRGLIVGFY